MDVVLQNCATKKPLIINAEIICNTPDEKILENVRINSQKCKHWQKFEPENNQTAILVGSGPSLAEYVEEIRGHQNKGAVVYAMNGAAKYLFNRGVVADYQVILDAKEDTIGHLTHAYGYLFASQVDPMLFEVKPEAKLWHATHGNNELDFLEHDDDFCLIGGSISVGNAALVLAYSRGHRTLHCYGYDSSHKEGKGHAFLQKQNDGDPCTTVRFRGKEYVCSLTMRLQASYFFQKAFALKREGVEIFVHGEGLLPDMYNAETLSEKDKYEMMWMYREYGDVSTGADLARLGVEKLGLKDNMTVLDLGCGSGKGGVKLRFFSGCNVIQTDIAENARDEHIYFSFYVRDLREPIGLLGDAAYCCDVMEHIPPDDVDKTIHNIMQTAPKAFFGICLINDNFGDLIGQPLHLSVHPKEWWQATFERLGYKVEWSEVTARPYGEDAYACFLISTT